MKTMTLKQKAVEIVGGLPPAKVKRVMEYLEYLEGDYDTFDVQEKVKSGLREVKLMKEGKLKPQTLKGFLRDL